MRLTLRILGLTLIDLTLEESSDSSGDDNTDLGYTLSTPTGFTPTPGDQRWETGVDYQ